MRSLQYPSKEEFNFPNLYLIKQEIKAPRIENVIATLNQKLDKFKLSNKVRPGERVAITAGSRGIKDNPKILKELVSRFKALGALPFIVPAMGSHGGAIAEGQVEVLRSLGIEESTINAPIISSIDVVEIGRTRDDVPIMIGRDFTQADHIVIVNRIKPHTDFVGEIESGLLKIMVIGMSKPFGAMLAHKSITNHGFEKMAIEIGRVILKKLPILMGIGIVENQYYETAYFEVIEPNRFISDEKRLLRKAKRILGKIPFEKIDLLIVDEMGKQISGSGMDTKVIGRIMNLITPEPPKRKIKRIFVRDLTKESNGNACGIGLADYTTERLVSKVDKEVTKINSVMGSCPEKGRIPIAFNKDKDAIIASLNNAGVYRFKEARLVWIKNTLHLKYLKISEALAEETKTDGRLVIVEGPIPFSFDENGNLPFGTFPEDGY